MSQADQRLNLSLWLWVKVRTCRYTSKLACERTIHYFVCLYSSCVHAYVSQRMHVNTVYSKVFDSRGGHFEVFKSPRHFSCSSSSLQSVLALGPTVIL